MQKTRIKSGKPLSPSDPSPHKKDLIVAYTSIARELQEFLDWYCNRYEILEFEWEQGTQILGIWMRAKSDGKSLN